MERSYKPAMEHEAAVKTMIKEKGSHFDPFRVEVFSSLGDDFKRIFEDNQDVKKSA
jgi:response regulator RpfG family c-di-GMP phosphodiesterase